LFALALPERVCTFALAWQVFADAPVVVAANRDERLDRPARPPAVIEDEPRVIAPQDEEASGTWIGYNEHGVLVAVLNYWVDADLAGERSRGLLVRDALTRESAEAAGRYVEDAVREHEYEGFEVVAADPNAAVLYQWDGQLSVTQFRPGVHVVGNVGADGRYRIPEHRAEYAEARAESTDRVAAELVPEPGETAVEWRDRAKEVLGDHEFGACVHGDGFGTRSSSLIVLGEDGASYEFANGPPCETAYEPVAVGEGGGER